ERRARLRRTHFQRAVVNGDAFLRVNLYTLVRVGDLHRGAVGNGRQVGAADLAAVIVHLVVLAADINGLAVHGGDKLAVFFQRVIGELCRENTCQRHLFIPLGASDKHTSLSALACIFDAEGAVGDGVGIDAAELHRFMPVLAAVRGVLQATVGEANDACLRVRLKDVNAGLRGHTDRVADNADVGRVFSDGQIALNGAACGIDGTGENACARSSQKLKGPLVVGVIGKEAVFRHLDTGARFAASKD